MLLHRAAFPVAQPVEDAVRHDEGRGVCPEVGLHNDANVVLRHEGDLTQKPVDGAAMMNDGFTVVGF